jgi:polyisoprenoid-binding protein YceI
MKKTIIVILAAFLAFGITGYAQDYKVVTDKSTVRWTGKKVGKDHTGKIALKEGSFTLKNGKFTSGQFVIDMNAMTNEDIADAEWNAKLVGHLKSDDFFSVEKFPLSTLKIRESTKFDKDEATITADLTIKGITHPVTFKVKRIGDVFQASVVFDRSKYDVKYASGKFFSSLGDNAIDDMIPIDVTLVALATK